MGPLDRVADAIVHGARESFLRTLTTRLVGALRALVSGTGSEARAANALDMASARVSEQAMGTWAEFRPRVTAQAAREVGAALRDSDETLSRELAAATGADRPWGLSNRARNDLAEATRGVREVVGRRNVRYEPTEAAAIAQRAAAAQAMQGATDAHTAAQAWYEVAGAAITRVDMGDDPADVMRDAVAELARRGLETVDYRSGARTSVDAAVRRHVDSQLNQAANDMAMRQCEEWGVGLVMVDAHWGARPSHARWQGKAYSLHGEVKVDGVTYPDLYEATGYQGRNGWPLGAQLAGVNCRHRMYPYVPGVSQIPSDDFEAMARKYGMTSEEYYEATQRQRALERALRAAKREAAFLEDEGLDATAQRYRIGDLQRKLRELCRTTGLERDPTREKAYGVTHQPRGLKRPETRSWTAFAQSDEVANAIRASGASRADALALMRDALRGSGTDLATFGRMPRRDQLEMLDDLLKGREKAPVYQAAISVQNARMATHLGMGEGTVDLSGLDLFTARSFARAAGRMAEAIPGLRGLAKKVATVEPGFEPDELEDAYAWTNANDATVSISLRNCAKRGDLRDSLTSDVMANQHPRGCAREGYIVFHELTHIIDAHLASTGRFGEVDFASEAVQAQIMASCGLTVSDAHVSKNVSKYAEENPTEWLAEAVAEGLCSPRPRPVAKTALAWVQSQLR